MANPGKAPKRTLLLIDGHNFLWRANSIPFSFHSDKGTPLHVTSTFLSLLRRTMTALGKKAQPSHCVVVFDPKGPTSNHLLSESYKANRVYDFENEEDSPFFHLPFIKRVLRHLRIKNMERKAMEADDVIASIATRFVNEDERHQVYIASTDSDFYQLLSPQVRQLVLKREGAHTIVDAKWLRNELGITPADYVRFKSITGDSADNIAGVPKIGKIGARDILLGKRVFDLAPFEERLKLNEQLIRLNRNAKVTIRWDDVAFSGSGLDVPSTSIFKKLRF